MFKNRKNVSQNCNFPVCRTHVCSSDAQEYKRKQIEEQRQAERLQRQLQQERAYLVSLQQQQQQQEAPPPRPPQDKKQLYHYKDQAPGSSDKPAWAKEVRRTGRGGPGRSRRGGGRGAGPGQVLPGCSPLSAGLTNTGLALQVMRRAQSNSPRIPPKKYHSFKETRDTHVDDLLLLPGYKPPRPRPPSYPVHVSPSRNQLHVPRIRVTCVPEPAGGPEARGRSPARRVSRRSRSLLGPGVCAG